MRATSASARRGAVSLRMSARRRRTSASRESPRTAAIDARRSSVETSRARWLASEGPRSLASSIARPRCSAASASAMRPLPTRHRPVPYSAAPASSARPGRAADTTSSVANTIGHRLMVNLRPWRTAPLVPAHFAVGAGDGSSGASARSADCTHCAAANPRPTIAGRVLGGSDGNVTSAERGA